MVLTKKTKASVKPTPAEMQMMRVLWEIGPATAKQVHEHAVKERPDLAYASVLRLLQVMHSKGQLARDESQKAHIYEALAEQDSVQTNLIKDLVQKAFAGSAKALVLAALRSHVSKEERAEIQKLLSEDEDPS